MSCHMLSTARPYHLLQPVLVSPNVGIDILQTDVRRLRRFPPSRCGDHLPATFFLPLAGGERSPPAGRTAGGAWPLRHMLENFCVAGPHLRILRAALAWCATKRWSLFSMLRADGRNLRRTHPRGERRAG